MKIEYEGIVYDFDVDDITVKQAIKIEKHTGMTLEELWKALSPEEEGKSADLIALQAFGWLVLHGGRDIPIEECDFKMVAFAEAFAKGAAEGNAAKKAQDEPDPTTLAGSSTPGMPGSTLSPTGPPGSPPPVSSTVSGRTG